jgi:UDP-glucose 4-epimerase
VGESVANPAKYYQNNLAATLTLLEGVRKAGIRHFIFSSTCASYGNPLAIPITEEHPQNPINPYGASKFMVERILKDYEAAYGIHSILFRYFNAAGADPSGEIGEWHDPETHLIPLVLDVAAGFRDSIQVFGTDYATPDGTCIRDYLHVNDIARAHILGLQHLEARQAGGAFNLGNGSGFSVWEVIRAAEKVTGRKIQARETPRRPGDPPVLVGSAEKACRVLGWKTEYPSLEQILETAWHWHQRFRRIANLPQNC